MLRSGARRPSTAQVPRIHRDSFLLRSYLLYKREYNTYILYLCNKYPVMIKFPCCITFLLLYGIVGFGQSPLSVTGVVADVKSNRPLAFATVVLKGTARGALADETGKFQLNVPAIHAADTLAVTYLGY